MLEIAAIFLPVPEMVWHQWEA